jgi:uncharacterized LabA/DUF88 family protein
MTEPIQKVWVFIDGQNLYRDTRRAFFKENDSTNLGQVDPVKLANLLTDRGTSPQGTRRVLDECHIYTGIPSANKQPIANAARLRQKAAWEASGAIVHGRPLRYPKTWPSDPAQEKGVDVELAVDLVFNAARRNYDVGIVVSTDTDLLPALQAVCNLHRAWGTPRMEVVAWVPLKKRLSLPATPIWFHRLEKPDYDIVKDETRYATPSLKP